MSSTPQSLLLALPDEIQLIIFESIADELTTKHGTGANNRQTRTGKHRKKLSTMLTAESLLLTNRAIYEKFAPLFWQIVTVAFPNPDYMAGFLKHAKPTVISNVRHIRLTLQARCDPWYDYDYGFMNDQAFFTNVHKTRNFICHTNILADLDTFVLHVETGNQNGYCAQNWKVKDPVKLAKYRCLDDLEAKVRKGTFKNFTVEKAAWVSPGTEVEIGTIGNGLVRLDMLFSRTPGS